MASRKKPETAGSLQDPNVADKDNVKHPPSSVSMNRDAITTLVQSCSIDKIKSVYAVLVEAKEKCPQGKVLDPAEPAGTLPCLLDIQRWVAALTPFSSDAKFCADLIATCESRIPKKK